MIDQKKLKSISQKELGLVLGLSRPLISNIQNGKRVMKPEEEKKLVDYLEMMEGGSENMRINIPQGHVEKFKQVFLYMIERVGARTNVGMTVLYKLLYFIDFDYYEKYEEQLMGLTYFKNTHGPTPREFKKIVDEMIAQGEVEKVKSNHFQYEQIKFLPIKSPDLSLLNGRELEMIDDVLDRYGNKTASELSDLSHQDTPWRMAKDKEDLEYEYAFYRPDQFSVRDYGTL